jgi:hypothetical protein
VSSAWTREYKTYGYTCWHCRERAVFTAADQKYTYEIKKAPIDQKRILCEKCWKRMNAIAAQLEECQGAWLQSKSTLRSDQAFLQRWFDLLQEQEQYVPYKRDVARKNMLAKLISDA